MKPTSAKPLIVSFRLDAEATGLLNERAARLGVSPHELARYYVTESLHAAEELAAVGTAVDALHQQVRQLNQDLALATEALLASAGRASEKQAHAWVEASLNRA